MYSHTYCGQSAKQMALCSACAPFGHVRTPPQMAVVIKSIATKRHNTTRRDLDIRQTPVHLSLERKYRAHERTSSSTLVTFTRAHTVGAPKLCSHICNRRTGARLATGQPPAAAVPLRLVLLVHAHRREQSVRALSALAGGGGGG